MSVVCVQASIGLEQEGVIDEAPNPWNVGLGEGFSYFSYSDPVSTALIEEQEGEEPVMAFIPEVTGLLVVLLWVLFFVGLYGRVVKQRNRAARVSGS